MNPELQEYPRSRSEKLADIWYVRFICGVAALILLLVLVQAVEF